MIMFGIEAHVGKEKDLLVVMETGSQESPLVSPP